MTRTRIALTLTTLGLAGLLGLTGCGAGPTPAVAPADAAADTAPADSAAAGVVADVADVADEAYALAAVGLTTGLEADPAPSAPTGGSDKSSGATAGSGAKAGSGDKAGKDTAGKDKAPRHPGLRRFLKKNTLHGELTLQGRNGVKTVVVQRGTVTAVAATTVTVKSTDGFTQSWTYGDKPRVVQDRQTVTAAAVKVGAEIGIAGAKDGNRNVARLVVIK